jgi:hypothetical protein
MTGPGTSTTVAWHSGRSRAWAYLVLAAILAGSLALNVYGNRFPLGYHFDEPRKVRFIEEGRQNFFHPVLMLQVSRIADAVADVDDPQAVVERGRTLTALFATLNVLASFLLFRFVAGTRIALWTAAAVAVMPGLVVHAHYLKEDMYLVPFLMLSLHAFLRWRERGDARSLAWWGVATGLALSSKYVAVLLFASYAWVLRKAPHEATARQSRPLGRMALIAVATFCVVNYAIFLDPGTFLGGFSSEATRSVKGAVIKLWPWSQYFTFHLRQSLAPSVTWAWVALGAVGMLALRRRPEPRLPAADLLLLGFVAIWLGTAELTPKKPYPDYLRYVIPIVPVVAYYGVRGLDAIAARATRDGTRLAALLCAIALAWPLYDSVRLVRQLEHDTRARVAGRIPPGARVIWERFTSTREDVRFATQLPVEELRSRGVGYLVTSGFNWQILALGASMAHQKPEVYRLDARYRALFEACPYERVVPDFEPYAFSNPELRVVHVAACLDRLRY